MAARALDRAEAARAQINREGMVVQAGGSQGVKAHPLLAVEKDARALFLRTMQKLNLDAADPA